MLKLAPSYIFVYQKLDVIYDVMLKIKHVNKPLR